MSYNCIIFHFCCADYAKALTGLHQFLTSPARELRRDLKTFARLLLVIVHYELGRLESLDTLIRSAYRSLNKQIGDFEKFLIKHIHAMAGAASREERSGLNSILYE